MSRRLIWIAFLLSALSSSCAACSLARPIWNVKKGSQPSPPTSCSKAALHRDSVNLRGPVTYCVYALVFELAGKNNMVALHLALIGMIVAVLGLIALLGNRILPPRGVAFALIYFAVASTFAFPPMT